jgi:hypothetical protein
LVSLGKRQLPREAEKAAEPMVLPAAIVGHRKGDLPATGRPSKPVVAK